MLQWKIGRSLNPASKKCAVEGHPAFTIQNAYAGGRRRRCLCRLRRRLRSSNLKFHRSQTLYTWYDEFGRRQPSSSAHTRICICAQLGAWLGTLSWLKVVFFRLVLIFHLATFNFKLTNSLVSRLQHSILLCEILNA